MKNAVSVMSCLAVLGCGASAGGRNLQLSESERIEIAADVRVMLSEYLQAVNSGDLSQILEFYADAPDFHWVENGAVAYDSYAAVKQAFDALQSSVSSIQLEFSDTRVVPLAPNVASVTGGYEQVFVDTSGASFDARGTITAVAVLTGDGWKFFVGHASQPRTRQSSSQ